MVFENEKEGKVKGLPYYSVSLILSLLWLILAIPFIVLRIKGIEDSYFGHISICLGMCVALINLTYTIFYGDCIRILRESAVMNKDWVSLDFLDEYKMREEAVNLMFDIMCEYKLRITLKRIYSIMMAEKDVDHSKLITDFVKDVYKKHKKEFKGIADKILYIKYKEYMRIYEDYKIKSFTRAYIEVSAPIFEINVVYGFLNEFFDSLKESNEIITDMAIKQHFDPDFVNAENIFDHMIERKTLEYHERIRKNE